MWLVDKMLDMVRLTDDGDDDGYGYDEEDGYEDEEEDNRGSRGRRYAASRNAGQEMRRSALQGSTGTSRLSVQQGSRRSTRGNGVREICLVKTESFEDSADVARYLLAGVVVLLDIKGTGTDLVQRVVDFVCGTVYAIEGDVRSISAGIFIAAPAGVDLTGEFGDLKELDGLDSQAVAGSLRWMAADRAAAKTASGAEQERAYRVAV